MPLAHCVVVEVVRRSDLYATSAEFPVYVRVADHWNGPVDERKHDVLADHGRISLIVGMHGYCRISKQRFRAGRRHYQAFTSAFVPVTDFPYFPVLLLSIDFQV